MLLGLQLRHPEQEAEHVQLVATRQSGMVGDGFGDKGHSLVRPALPAWFIALRTPLPARGCARPPTSCAGQEITSNWRLLINIRLLRVQLWDAFYNFFDITAQAGSMLSTCVDLTGTSAAPMFGTKRPRRILRNR